MRTILLAICAFVILTSLSIAGPKNSLGLQTYPGNHPVTIYNQQGHVQNTIRSDAHHNLYIYDNQGHLKSTIKPDGRIMNQFGHEIGRIK
jgi:hypothetical protein